MAREPEEITHETVEQRVREVHDWPKYFVNGPDRDVPCYYAVGGPNGPVEKINEGMGRCPTTMYDFAMECQALPTERTTYDETPFMDRDSEVD